MPYAIIARPFVKVLLRMLFDGCFSHARLIFLLDSGWRICLVILLFSIDASQIEVLESIWCQVAAHKNRKFQEALSDVV